MTLRPIAQSVSPVASTALGKQGLALGGVVEHWAEIAGPELARNCQPARLAFPRGRRDGATLYVSASSSFALELQHRAPSLIERVNTYCGYGAVATLKIVQATPNPDRAPRRYRSRDLRPLAPEEEARITAIAGLIEDSELKEALAGLGRMLAVS